MRIDGNNVGLICECLYDDYTDWDECKIIGFDGKATVVAVDDGYVIASELRELKQENE